MLMCGTGWWLRAHLTVCFIFKQAAEALIMMHVMEMTLRDSLNTLESAAT